MLEIKVTGDEHPKTFTLVTDDANAELIRLQDILHEEMQADPEDPLRKWFDSHTAAQFADGVVIPVDEVGDFEMVIEGDWPEAAMVIAAQRQSALDEAEAKFGDG